MKLQQLRCVLEVVRRGNHITAAADALHTSQPGVSKQIHQLEVELGFPIFIRKRNHVVGLTEPGKEVLELARRMMADTQNLKHIREEFLSRDSGILTIATTHTHARYILPDIIERFAARHPNVQLALRQGNPTQVCEFVEAEEADIAVGTESPRTFPNLVKLPCFKLSRSIVVRAGHPLLKARHLTLQHVADYPIITHDPASSGRWKVMTAFEKARIKPNVISSAVDADICKTYVERGLGIAILATIAFDATRDIKLRAINANHLFEQSVSYVDLRRNTYPRTYILDFIQCISQKLTPELVRAALRGDSDAKQDVRSLEILA
jgi:LysR family transcriptional regulator, cys regulon transcriptional activator